MTMKKLIDLFFCHFLYQVTYTGLENLEGVQQCLICPNHSYNLDPFFIYPASHHLYIMAKAELFKHKLVAKILKHYHVFPVDRGKKDPKSLFYSLTIFETDEPRQLLIFPEGGVLKTEQEIGKRIRNGAVFISAQVGIPIIPVYITRRPKLFSKVDVVFGKPFYSEKELLKDKQKLKEKSKELIDTIYQLKL